MAELTFAQQQEMLRKAVREFVEPEDRSGPHPGDPQGEGGQPARAVSVVRRPPAAGPRHQPPV